jgi:3-isopropylmalate/(R)-2-methylmalate dehydratase small subunit
VRVIAGAGGVNAERLRSRDLARSFARIFLQNSINLGLNLVTVPGVEASVGDDLSVEGGELVNATRGTRTPIVKLPAARQAIIDAGGLIPYTRKLMLERSAAVK